MGYSLVYPFASSVFRHSKPSLTLSYCAGKTVKQIKVIE